MSELNLLKQDRMQWHVVHFVSLVLHVMKGFSIKRVVGVSICRLRGRVSKQCLIYVNSTPQLRDALFRFRVMPPPPPYGSFAITLRPLPDNTQHNSQTSVSPRGIRTHNPSKRAAADTPRTAWPLGSACVNLAPLFIIAAHKCGDTSS